MFVSLQCVLWVCRAVCGVCERAVESAEAWQSRPGLSLTCHDAMLPDYAIITPNFSLIFKHFYWKFRSIYCMQLLCITKLTLVGVRWPILSCSPWMCGEQLDMTWQLQSLGWQLSKCGFLFTSLLCVLSIPSLRSLMNHKLSMSFL